MNIDVLNELYLKRRGHAIPNLNESKILSSKEISNINEYISLLKFRLPIFKNEIAKQSLSDNSTITNVLNEYEQMIHDLENTYFKRIIVYLLKTKKGTLQIYTDENTSILITDFQSLNSIDV